MEFLLNQGDIRTSCFEGIAIEGNGVEVTLNTLCKMVMGKFVEDNNMTLTDIPDKEGVAVKGS
jgi:hypothetical protein